jgi:hypothetical protein
MSPSSTSTAAASPPAPRSRLSTLPEGEPPLTLGYVAAQWAHAWLVQPNGPRAGQPFRLTLDQFRFLLWWYAVDRTGAWLFHHGARRLAKGSGKSPFAAVLSLIEFCAPVRLERFDDRVPGGCRGKPVNMPLVQIAATAESQTANTMRMVRAFAPKGSKVVAEYHLDPGKTRYYRLPEGTLEVITSSATAAEGAEPSFIVGDETEHWKPSNGGVELAATLEDNLAKSGSRGIETANSWKPGQDTVAEATWDDWLAQEEGRRRGESLILYDARIAPPNTDMADPVSLRSALEWVYGDCDWKRPTPDAPPDVRSIMERIWTPSAKADDSKRKYLNQPTAPEDAWTTPERWARLANPDRIIDRAEEIALFFDGSKSRDATALVGCCLSDGHVFTIDVWEPDPSHDSDDAVDVADVDRTVRRARAGDFGKVVAFFADVQEWESFTKIDWPELFEDELVVEAVPGGKDPQAIAWDMRSHSFDFTAAAELAEAEITEGAFTHDDDPRLARHVANMRRRPNRYGISVGKESPSSPLKIDAGVCMIGARMVRRRALTAGTTKRKRSGKVW